MAGNIREELSVLIGDDNPTNEKYTDHALNIFIRSALNRLKSRVGLAISISNGTLVPAASQEESDLILLQVRCMIARREYVSASRKGIKIRQGDSSIDTTSVLTPYKDLSKEVCTQLEESIIEYITKKIPEFDSVTSLYAENIWHGTQHLYETGDHAGDGSNTYYQDGPGGHRKIDTDSGDDRFTGG